MKRSVTIYAPAKVNLGLEVLRRRSDGFHEINTLFAAVDLCDRVTITRRDDERLTLGVIGNDRLGDEDLETNLCVKGIRALRETTGDRTGFDITLHKTIPIGAGLGGGSSDAAATLLGASGLIDAELTQSALPAIAAAIGSDVPFFIRGGIAAASGRGDILHPIDLQLPWRLLLVNPGIHIPTPWAYGALNVTGNRPPADLLDGLRSGIADPAGLRDRLVNDFEPVVFAEYPVLAEIKERLYAAGACFALMSGSGSTMFGLFEDRIAAERAAAAFSSYWSAVVPFRPASADPPEA